MEENKIISIKKLDNIRKEILNSNFQDFPKKIDLLESAYQISLNAPLRIITRPDGIKFDNGYEREHTLSMFRHDIEYIKTMKSDEFKFWQFQTVATMVMLMNSISDGGLYEIEQILKQ